jgi:hypothetical protein
MTWVIYKAFLYAQTFWREGIEISCEPLSDIPLLVSLIWLAMCNWNLLIDSWQEEAYALLYLLVCLYHNWPCIQKNNLPCLSHIPLRHRDSCEFSSQGLYG